MKKMIKVVSIIVATVLIVLILAMFFLAKTVYDKRFNFKVEATPGTINTRILKREAHTFKTNNNNNLEAFLYESADIETEKKAVLVFAHGLGASQSGYIDIYEYMVSRGYYVFAYNITATGGSDGEVIGGIPQGVIDLDNAISYVKTIEKTKNLPIVLMGYSWGAISVTNVLNYQPDVKAVAALAGCNESMDLLRYHGYEMVGPATDLFLPFARLYEFFKYGEYAFSSSMKGFENSNAAVMIIHDVDDKTVPFESGYKKYYEQYKDNERFVFKQYNGRDHNLLYHTGSLDLQLISNIADFFDLHV